MNQKDQGFVGKLLPVLLSTGMVFGLIMLSGQFMEILRTREVINQTARAYLLEMETVGCLSEADSEALKKELAEACGMTDISLSGTTVQQVGYGERIYLVISGNIKQNLKVQIPFMYEELKAWNIPIRMKWISTAKH
ncbi:MAG: hypothetical protein IJZ84_02465 [Lachnospiraceae bacterium]|nr:hypothetical protein [Lachnospiraceae bacterium]